MRILIVSNLYPPLIIGGYELACSNVAEALSQRGHDIRVLTTWCPFPSKTKLPTWVDRSLDMHCYVPHHTPGLLEQGDMHRATCSSYANTLRLLQVIREFRPELVSLWNPTGIGSLALMDLLNQLGVPWSLHLGDRVPIDITDNVPPHVRVVFCESDTALYARACVLSVSQHLLDEIESTVGITFENAAIVAGWGDASTVQPHAPYLRDGEARFVAAGGIYPHKGIDLIIEASERLKAQGLRFSVDIFGSGDVPRYVEMVRMRHLQDCVRLLGPRKQSELLRAYANYDAFLCPTWERDPFPFAPLEAAACATPPILTRNCGTSERLVGGIHCLKIDRTVDGLAQAMANVASGQVDLARIGRVGQRLIRSDLSFDRYLDRVEAALRAHATPWRQDAADNPALPLLAFVKHNLSLQLRFG
jgi:glycosyltransferase involved in cell wall biosynthesis